MVGALAIGLGLFYGLTNFIGLFVRLFVFRDPENSLLQNLKDVLEIDFPARSILEESVSLIISFNNLHYVNNKI
jgi:hypothetical protein